MEIVKRNEGENMQIRRMKLEDYKEVDRLMAQVHKIHVEGRPDLYVDVEHIYSMETFKKMVEDPDTISIAAEVDGTIAGICFVSMRDRTCMVKRKTVHLSDGCFFGDRILRPFHENKFAWWKGILSLCKFRKTIHHER